MGLGALFGMSRKPDPSKPLLSAPAPSTAAAPIAAMPDTVRNGMAGAAMSALSAAQKARKKAAAGSSPSTAQPTGTILTSTAQPKTLLGY